MFAGSLALASALVSVALADPGAPTPPDVPADAAAVEGDAPAVATPTPPSAETEALFSALQLPVLASSLRATGVPPEEVVQVLEAAKEAGVDAADASAVLRHTMRDVRESGTVEGLGDLVQAKLAEGLRGRDLADAIHAEHLARGKKVAKRGKKATPSGAWPGPPGAHDAPPGVGRPTDAGKSANAGKAADAGKPDGAAKSGAGERKGKPAAAEASARGDVDRSRAGGPSAAGE